MRKMRPPARGSMHVNRRKSRLFLDIRENRFVFLHYYLELARQHHIDELPCPNPLVFVRKHLGEDVRRHALAAFMSKLKESGPITLMNPSNLNPMGPLKVTHRRVLARLNDLQHGLIILQETHPGRMWQQALPQLQARTPNNAQGMARRNQLRLRCGVAY